MKTLADCEFDIVVNEALLARMNMPLLAWVYFIRKFVSLPENFWEKNEDVFRRNAMEAEGLDCYILPCMDGYRLPVKLMATPYPRGSVALYVERYDITNPTINQTNLQVWKYPSILDGAPTLEAIEKSGLLKRIGGDGAFTPARGPSRMWSSGHN